MKDRLLIAVTAMLAAALAIVGHHDRQATAERTPEQTCLEVSQELIIQVQEGSRSQESAVATIRRCYELFVDTTP